MHTLFTLSMSQNKRSREGYKILSDNNPVQQPLIPPPIVRQPASIRENVNHLPDTGR